MQSHHLVLLAGLLAAATLAAGCGRKSDLDTPSMARQAEREASGTQGEAPPPQAEDRRFILDSLID